MGRENSLPVLLGVSGAAALWHGAHPCRAKSPKACSTLKAGLAIWEGGGGKVCEPLLQIRSRRSHGAVWATSTMRCSSSMSRSHQIERPGWEERFHYAEILRLKGWMLSLKGDLEGAEQNYLASLDWARQQQAKSWELRTSTSLARLWQSQGKRKEAHELLAPVYNWFTEGFDTKRFEGSESAIRRTPDARGVGSSILSRAHAQALYVIEDAFFASHRTTLLELASRAQLPAINAPREFADAGGLMSYGTNVASCGINRPPASTRSRRGQARRPHAFGITIPESILLRADEVTR